jgi:hypothetical protein
MVANKAFLGCAALTVAIQAKAHVDFMDRFDPIHRLDRSMTLLARDARPDVRLMGKTDKIGQGINPVPFDFEGRLLMIRPRTRNRLQAADQGIAMAADTALHGRHARGLRPSRVLVAILARNLINACVDPMAERYRLLNILQGRPWALGKSQHAKAGYKNRYRDRD